MGGALKRTFQAAVLSPFTGHTLIPLLSIARTEDLNALTALIESGKVTPAVDRVYPLAEAAEAVRRLEQANICGKVVVRP